MRQAIGSCRPVLDCTSVCMYVQCEEWRSVQKALQSRQTDMIAERAEDWIGIVGRFASHVIVEASTTLLVTIVIHPFVTMHNTGLTELRITFTTQLPQQREQAPIRRYSEPQ